MIRPRELSTQFLFDQWHQGESDYDVTVMRLVVEGEHEGKAIRRTYDLCDRFDRERGISSMARTTGYPCAAVARLIARGAYTRSGIIPPELIGADSKCYAAIMGDLERRNVVFQVSEEEAPTIHMAS
jgi:lysine 6-dehydrogenase